MAGGRDDFPRRLSRRQILRSAAIAGGGAVAGALLTACGGSSAKGDATASAGQTTGTTLPAAANLSRPVTISEWGFGVDATNPLAAARMDAFKQAYPQIKVEITPKVEDQKILTNAVSNQLPDLLWLGREKLASWASRNVLRPLDGYVERDQFDLGAFYPAAVDEVKYDGKLYGIPQFISVRGLYINNDALKEVGVDPAKVDTGDWDALTDLGKRLTKRTGDKVDRWGFDTKISGGLFYLWGLGNGGAFLGPDNKTATFNDPKLVDALAWGMRNYEAQGGYRSYLAVSSTFQNDEQFARGQVAIVPYEEWLLGVIARVAPNMNFSFLPLKRRGGSDSVSYTTGQAWTITKNAKHVDAAWEFIKFMNATDTWLIGANAKKDYNKRNKKGPFIPSLTGSKAADQLQLDQVYEPISPTFDAAMRLLPQLLERSQNTRSPPRQSVANWTTTFLTAASNPP